MENGECVSRVALVGARLGDLLTPNISASIGRQNANAHLQRLGDLAHTVRQIELVTYPLGNESNRPSRASLLS